MNANGPHATDIAGSWNRGNFMKIARVTAHALNPPVPIRRRASTAPSTAPSSFVEIETDTGIVGHGITSLAPAKGAAALIANTVTPLILGMDARRIADVWNAMYRELGHRGQTGLAYHAISAIDIALWDIRGKALKEPVWRLLGGARDKVPCYVTMGLPSMDRDQLASVAKDWVGQGMGGVKMVVGVIARDRAHEFPNMTEALLEDARRVKAVRDAVGHSIEIAIDINCELDPAQALTLVRMCAGYGLAFVEEPVPDNDARQMADFRRQTGLQIAAGQSMGALYRFKEAAGAAGGRHHSAECRELRRLHRRDARRRHGARLRDPDLQRRRLDPAQSAPAGRRGERHDLRMASVPVGRRGGGDLSDRSQAAERISDADRCAGARVRSRSRRR